jgi:hypothetical protein
VNLAKKQQSGGHFILSQSKLKLKSKKKLNKTLNDVSGGDVKELQQSLTRSRV